MKFKTCALIFTFYLICLNLHAKEFCSARLVIDPGVTHYVSQGHTVVEVNSLDSIDFWVTFEIDTDLYYQCICTPNNSFIEHDTVITYGIPFHITETGVYYVSDFAMVLSGDCNPRVGSIMIEVIYSTSSAVSDLNDINETTLYPTASSGIYNLKSKNKITSIHVADYSGRLIVNISNPSVIDLSSFSSGIYFYDITDEKGDIFRGRIVKE